MYKIKNTLLDNGMIRTETIIVNNLPELGTGTQGHACHCCSHWSDEGHGYGLCSGIGGPISRSTPCDAVCRLFKP